jgi:coenzyme F420-0:L-glutamate ligase/coenzyme F420-1:gamma-L-glutamate ligase
MEDGPVARAIKSRRSIRSFSAQSVDPRIVEHLVALACRAPAPHHTRPWRFVHIASVDARERLADAMTDAWRADLEAADRPVQEVARLLGRSREQIMEPPLLLLSCVVLEGSKPWPDDSRRQGERDMFVQSLGAALQNVLLAAEEVGLAGYLKGAPLFCQDAVRDVLRLPPEWEPAFLVQLGYATEGLVPQPRDPIDTAEFVVER